MSKYVITYDVGTTGVKTCLIEIGDTMRILASDTAGYGLYVDDETGVKGGAEVLHAGIFVLFQNGKNLILPFGFVHFWLLSL
mgnify:CR=1 FL=1